MERHEQAQREDQALSIREPPRQNPSEITHNKQSGASIISKRRSTLYIM